MSQLLSVFKYHLVNSYLYLIETIYDLYKLIISIVLLVTIPIWYVPVVVFIKLMEPSVKRKQEEETEKVIDRMFPNKKEYYFMKLENRLTAIYEVGDIVESFQGVGTVIQTHEVVVNDSFVSQRIYIQHEKGDKNNPVCKTANDVILIRNKNETD